jgi:hypothetical protein
MRDLLQQWQQQQQQGPQAPVEQLAEAASLRLNPDAYTWLNEQLRGIRVSTAGCKDAIAGTALCQPGVTAYM